MAEYVGITPAHVESLIAKIDFVQVGNKTTVCVITLVNKMEVVGYSIRQENVEHCRSIAERSAFDHAFNNLWPIAISYYNANPIE